MSNVGCKKDESTPTLTNIIQPPPPPPTIIQNTAPNCNAGLDINLLLPTNSCTLIGQAFDAENNVRIISWSKISGPLSFLIEHPDSLTTKVNNLQLGVYQFELTVTDSMNLYDSDTIQVTVSPDSLVDIYVTGNENNLPVYWKNGQMIPIGAPSGYTGTSIAVVDGVIGVAETKNGLLWTEYRAKYWKNGQEITLGTYAQATSITLVGNDVFVAGWEKENSNSRVVAKYWKNGQAVLLSDGTRDEYANCIFVNGSDVYVAGQEFIPPSNYIAKYWKNGQAVLLTSASSYAWANSITVVNSRVYVAGQENGIAKYWKNEQSVSLSEGNATSLVVVDSDVYVAGYKHMGQGNSIAKYWKNNQEFQLTSGSEAFATSIAVFGNDVYVAGSEGNSSGFNFVPKYWKNGQPVPLTTGSNRGLANSIVVVRR